MQFEDANSTVHSVKSSCIPSYIVAISNEVHSQNASWAALVGGLDDELQSHGRP
jgi:hypothetical protein